MASTGSCGVRLIIDVKFRSNGSLWQVQFRRISPSILPSDLDRALLLDLHWFYRLPQGTVHQVREGLHVRTFRVRRVVLAFIARVQCNLDLLRSVSCTKRPCLSRTNVCRISIALAICACTSGLSSAMTSVRRVSRACSLLIVEAHFLPLGLPAPRRAPPCVKDFKISKFLSSSFFGHWTPDTPPIKGEKCPFGVLDRVSGEFRTKCPAMD